MCREKYARLQAKFGPDKMSDEEKHEEDLNVISDELEEKADVDTSTSLSSTDSETLEVLSSSLAVLKHNNLRRIVPSACARRRRRRAKTAPVQSIPMMIRIAVRMARIQMMMNRHQSHKTIGDSMTKQRVMSECRDERAEYAPVRQGEQYFLSCTILH